MELIASGCGESSALKQLRINPRLRVREPSHRDGNGNNAAERIVSSDWVFSIATTVEVELNSSSSTHNSLIGIALEKGALFVAAVIGVLRSRGNNAFMALDSTTAEYALRQCSRFKISRILGRKALLERMVEAIGEDRCFTFDEICPGTDIYLTSALDFGTTMEWTNEEGKPLRILYAIQTSGSTGEPKTIHVPERSIMPNVVDFIERFSLDENSRILFSTSLSFDPSMVELLMAMHAGCELTVADNTHIHNLEETITSCRPDFIQLTPAMLQYFSAGFLSTLFGADSPSRCVLIGGEEFPLNFLRSKWNSRCSAKIFNVYGVTEVSCWASCYELSRVDIEDRRVPIGKPIAKTQLMIDRESGLLVIQGRGCVTNFSNAHGDVTRTGDYVMRVDSRRRGEKPRIYVQGRTKPNSALPSTEIEALVTETHQEVALCRCVYVGDCRFLFAWHCDGTSTLPDGRLKKTLPRHLWPTRVFWNVDNKCLLNASGKVDVKALRSYVENAFQSQAKTEGGLKRFLREAYSLEVDDEETASCTLRSLGLGSLELAEIALFLKSALHCPLDGHGELVNHLLPFNDELTIGDLISAVERHTALRTTFTQTKQFQTGVGISEKSSALSIQPNQRFHAHLIWEADLAKCIDASPVMRGSHLYIGSHAGILRCFEVEGGRVIEEFIAPGRRFERSCTVTENYVVIGSYTRFDAEDGDGSQWSDLYAKWKGELFIFTPQLARLIERIPTEGEIRVIPTVEGPNIYWCSQGGVLHEKDMLTGVLASHCVCRKSETGIRASLLLDGQLIVMATLGAELVAWHRYTRKVVWRREVKGPVFADLLLLPTVSHIFCVITALGSLSLHHIEDGTMICELDTGDPVFNMPTLLAASEVLEGLLRALTSLMLVGSGSGHILLMEFDGISIRLLRKCTLPDSKLARSPLLIDRKDVFAMTSKGLLFHMELNDLLRPERNVIEADIVLSVGAETFGSPVVTATRQRSSDLMENYKVIVGSRDNKLRCFGISQ